MKKCFLIYLFVKVRLIVECLNIIHSPLLNFNSFKLILIMDYGNCVLYLKSFFLSQIEAKIGNACEIYISLVIRFFLVFYISHPTLVQF